MSQLVCLSHYSADGHIAVIWNPDISHVSSVAHIGEKITAAIFWLHFKLTLTDVNNPSG
jgi:hypothetical protein